MHLLQQVLTLGILMSLVSCAERLPAMHSSPQSPNSIPLTVVGFNVESGGANPHVIAEQHIKPLDGVDIWGFSEVQNDTWLKILEHGTEQGEKINFRSILGKTGDGDRLAIVYNSRLLQKVSDYELNALSFGGQVRSALVAQFRIRSTEEEFLFVVNHLYRSENERRHQQAYMLNTWARNQTLPIIAVGDYNFDFDVLQGDQGNRDRGFDLMVQDEIFQWVKPQALVASQCSPEYNSILDFVFVANGATTWSIQESAILFTDAGSHYCPDDETWSDHRPVMATFTVPLASSVAAHAAPSPVSPSTAE